MPCLFCLPRHHAGPRATFVCVGWHRPAHSFRSFAQALYALIRYPDCSEFPQVPVPWPQKFILASSDRYLCLTSIRQSFTSLKSGGPPVLGRRPEGASRVIKARVFSYEANLEGCEVPAKQWRRTPQREPSAKPSKVDSNDRSDEITDALRYGLELSRRGALLVSAKRKVCVMNQSALEILRQGDGLRIEDGYLVTSSPWQTRRLTGLLQKVIAFPEEGEPRFSPVALRRSVPQSDLILRVLPGTVVGALDRTALVTLFDPDQGLTVDVDELRRLYGLTKGEATLAGRLVRGRSVEEAADDLFLSVHTVRTHLKRIFVKTDTHRQPELIAQVLAAVL